MSQRTIFFCLCLFLFGNGFFALMAQTRDSLSPPQGFVSHMTELAESVLDVVSVEKGRHSWAVYPAVGYTPRTGIEFGLMPIWRINPVEGGRSRYHRPTTVTSNLLWSTTGMYEADLEVDAFTFNGIRVWCKWQWLFLPDKFYGVGNQSADTEAFGFDATKLQLSGMVAKALSDSWFLGLSFDFGTYSHRPTVVPAPNALPIGAAGGWTNQLGPTLVFDTRNNATYPQKGWLVQLSGAVSRSWMGSGYSYAQASLDARTYHLWGSAVWANQFQSVAGDGDAPFFKLPALGGKRALRGIPHPNKYIDRHMWMAQSELRRDLWWRFGGVLFAGAGQSFGGSANLFDRVKCTVGVGLRFKALPAENLNFRIDYGVASGGDHALYFTLREAF